MAERTTVKSNCRFCGYQCGMEATVENGRVVKVRPDPSRYPSDEKILFGCKRWPNIPLLMDHPMRINYPLKRVGERGSGAWERVSWQQALDEIAERLADLKEKYGSGTLASSIGGPHTCFWPLHRFMTLFGSPNNMGIGQICWNPGIWVNTLTYGWPVDMELDPWETNCAILWGVNPADSDNSLFWRTVKEYHQTGKPLIVIDPRRTRTAEQGTLWLPLKPGTDPVLALALLHVVVKEKRYDEGFVERWCHGFAELKEFLQPYTPAYAATITGLSAEDIVLTARLYTASTPACIYSGRGIDQLGAGSVPTHRAIAILRAITGNLDIPGASHISEMPDFIPEIDLELSENMSLSVQEKQLNKGKLLLQTYDGYQKVRELTMQQGRRLPMRYLTSVHPNLVWKAMITGEPYPVRALIVMASDPLLTQADSKLIYEAMQHLDLMVSLELFLTPTAMMSDYILPSAGVMERPLLETKAGTANIAYGGDPALAPYYERKPDYYFWREVGIRLGQEKEWPWSTYREAMGHTISPLEITWEQFCQSGLYCDPSPYLKHEEIDPRTGLARGFATTTGKVELYSECLKALGGDPLPEPKNLPQISKEYPLLLMTGARFHPYYASSYRQVEAFRKAHPDPWAEMSAATAAKAGLVAGDEVWVETERGEARFVVKISQMCDETVSVEYGWWYPEDPAQAPGLGDMWISNANVLTSGDHETSDRLVGTWTYNGIPCRFRLSNEQ